MSLLGYKATTIAYDPQSKTLREAVDDLIFSKGGWHIEMDDEDIEDELHKAYLRGEDINTPEFFAPIKEERPWLSVGLRFDPLEGENYRLSQIEMLMMGAWYMGLQSDHAIEDMIFRANEHFSIWSSSLEGFAWCEESQKAYDELNDELKHWSYALLQELESK